jgi:hypothetical protein
LCHLLLSIDHRGIDLGVIYWLVSGPYSAPTQGEAEVLVLHAGAATGSRVVVQRAPAAVPAVRAPALADSTRDRMRGEGGGLAASERAAAAALSRLFSR